MQSLIFIAILVIFTFALGFMFSTYTRGDILSHHNRISQKKNNDEHIPEKRKFTIGSDGEIVWEDERTDEVDENFDDVLGLENEVTHRVLKRLKTDDDWQRMRLDDTDSSTSGDNWYGETNLGLEDVGVLYHARAISHEDAKRLVHGIVEGGYRAEKIKFMGWAIRAILFHKQYQSHNEEIASCNTNNGYMNVRHDGKGGFYIEKYLPDIDGGGFVRNEEYITDRDLLCDHMFNFATYDNWHFYSVAVNPASRIRAEEALADIEQLRENLSVQDLYTEYSIDEIQEQLREIEDGDDNDILRRY